ncbi:MAG: hydrogenase maturation protease [Ignavibacteria bacterium]
MKTLILGMGNTLLCDDGIGIIIKRYMEKNLDASDNVDFRETSWGGFKIIDLLRGYDYAVVIDSIKTGTKPQGYIHHLKPNDFLPTLRLNSYHDINFITALKLAETFHAKMPDDIDIFAIEVENTDIIMENLAPEIWDSINKCSMKVMNLLSSRNIIEGSYKDGRFAGIRSEKELQDLYIEEYNLS